ncbi:MAG: VCBS repeat-containing protein [Rhodobacteraceae bacterium]|jgi:hypothetical protein|nr:VCBS repeat-containing protein [Paracoccaceae bacterium]
MRRLASALLLALAPAALSAQTITSARYEGPTDRYPHGVLGDAVEHDTLAVTLADGRTLALRWPDTLVFEDTAPRLADLDGDGGAEVVVVESHEGQGARLAVYGLSGGTLALRAATPFIGTRFRWLAPAAIADLDGDGRVEIAYVDRPHLARVLRVVRYDPAGPRLAEVASAEGHTNHRIGDREILGGLRACPGTPPEIVTASPDWTRLMATRLEGGRLVTRDLGPNGGPGAVAQALACP